MKLSKGFFGLENFEISFSNYQINDLVYTEDARSSTLGPYCDDMLAISD